MMVEDAGEDMKEETVRIMMIIIGLFLFVCIPSTFGLEMESRYACFNILPLKSCEILNRSKGLRYWKTYISYCNSSDFCKTLWAEEGRRGHSGC